MHKLASAACLLAVACQAPDPAPTTAAPVTPADPSVAGALAHLGAARDELQRALKGERTALEQAENEALRRELEALARLVREARPAAAAPDPRAQDVRPSPAGERWLRDVRAIGATAAASRDAALEELRVALRSDDASAQLAALQTLNASGDVTYDHASFRPLVEPLVESASPAVTISALYALHGSEPRPGDLERVHAAWRRFPAELDDSVLHLMMLHGGGRLEGTSEEIALAVLADYSGENRGINGLWGAAVGPRLEARLLELARSPDREVCHGALYFGLSTLQDKSAAVVAALIAALADPDPNNWQRALWGLGQGVPAELQPRVVDALVELHAARSDPSTRRQCEQLARRYGGAEAQARMAR